MALSVAQNACASAPCCFENHLENLATLSKDSATHILLSSIFLSRGALLKLHAIRVEASPSQVLGDWKGSLQVVGRFNEIITRPLLTGALETFTRYQVRKEDIDVIWVPGSFEILVVAQQLASLEKYHAILCIGPMALLLIMMLPTLLHLGSCQQVWVQAIDRAGGKAGNKGAEAAITALEMASLFQHHLGGGLKKSA